MFEDKLFKEQESSFMGHFLADLDKSFPRILGSQPRTVRALTVLN
jgi:hypothetical protein